VIGEEATSATLRALSDCMLALALMDDTVGNIVSAWGEVVGAAGPGDIEAIEAKGKAIQSSYNSAFDAVSATVDRLNFAVQKYRELQEYGRRAIGAGRSEGFERALLQHGGEGFNTLVNNRIERLRTLKVRVKVLRQLQEYGQESIASNNFPEFFLMFMQPIRDMSLAINDLYGEVVRGALISHKAMFNVCQLPGEEIADETMKKYLKPAAAGA
jgi:hypothetical protein